MFGDFVEFVRGQDVVALDIVEQVDLKSSVSGPDVHTIVSHGRGAQEFFFEFHFAGEFEETRHLMNGGIRVNQFEFFGTSPQVRFIKPKDVVSDENIGIDLDHPLEPSENHRCLGRVRMNGYVRNGIAVGEDKEMAVARVFTVLDTACQCRSNLNGGITDEIHGFLKILIE